MTVMVDLMFGFHLGSGGGNQNGIGEYMQQLNAAGKAFCIMSADAFPLEAQQLMLSNPGVRHTVIFRRSVGHQGTLPPSGNPDVPEYTLPPAEAAARHFGWHLAHRPSEMHSDVWLMGENEIASRFEFDSEAGQLAIPLFDGLRQRYTRTDPASGATVYGVTNDGWMAAYSIHAAQMALDAGQRYAAFGWASGNPEPGDWTHPQMLALLRVMAQHPDRLAVGLHEYSWRTDDILHGNGRLVGRFEDIMAVCRAESTPYPTLLIKEWGWTHNHVPQPAQAMAHIQQVAEIYGRYPNIRGAAIWYLGPGFEGIANGAQRLIAPLTQLTLTTQVAVTLAPQPGTAPPSPPSLPPGNCPGAPREQYRREYWVVPGGLPEDDRHDIYAAAAAQQKTVGPSYDDAGIGALNDKTAVLYAIPLEQRQTFVAWYAQHYPGTTVVFRDIPSAPTPSPPPPPVPPPTPLPGPLPAPRLSQRDPRWANVPLGRDTGHGKTIGNWGCLLVAYTSLANHFGLVNDTPAQMNSRMVSAGAFSAQYIQPAALRTTFPNGVTYHGYKLRSDATMRPTIAAYLADGIPVAVRVDFHPATPQWEQHWVVLVGQTADDWLMMDPWHGDVTLVSARYGIAGEDVLEALFYRPKAPVAPPPATGTAVIGLHASADPGLLYGGVAEVQEFEALRPGVVKVLSAIADTAPPGRAALADLADKCRGAEWIVRAFLDFGERAISPQQFFNDTITDTLRTINCLRSFGVSESRIWIELHNEPNLRPEGFGISWANGSEFRSWLTAVHALYRGILPNMRYLYPGLSPGGDLAHGGSLLRRDAVAFLAESAGTIPALDGVGVHCYWSSSYPMSGALAHLDTYHRFNKPIWVTEASNNTRPPAALPSAAQYATEYGQFLGRLRQRPLVRGVTFFVASASNPEFHPESWIIGGQRKGIAALL